MRSTSDCLLLRADASKEGGAGHVVRCLALAEAWRERGGEAHFVCRTEGTFVGESIQRSGFAWTAPDEMDAEFLAEIAHKLKAGWTVLDGYDFDLAYECAVKAHWSEGHLAVVDDRLRPSVADLYVVPSSPLTQGAIISPGPTQLLGGLSFALLRKEFCQTKTKASAARPRILVVPGGTDASGLAEKAARSFASSAERKDWNIRIVSPPESYLPREDITFIAPSDAIAEELRAADVVICTASTVALEACACGKPQVLFVVADNQIPVARALCAAGAAVEVADPGLLAETVARVLERSTCERMAAEAAKLVDGRGAQRLVAAMMAFEFEFRPVSADDAELLFAWSNDPVVRRASFSASAIKWSDHLNWLQRRLSDLQSWMRIADDSAGMPFGILRLRDKGSGLFLLSISIAPSHRGLGLGARLLRAGAEEFFVEHPGSTIRAEVKHDNLASARAFLAAGFSPTTPQDDREIFILNHV